MDLAAGAHFDLLIADIGLPDGDGLDLLGRVREHQAIVGIALSGYGMEEDIRRSEEAGYVEHLVKPIHMERLEAAIARASGKRVVRQE